MYARIRKMIAEKMEGMKGRMEDPDFKDGYLTAMEDVQDALDAEDWIPVEDGSPAEDGYYCVTGKPKWNGRVNEKVLLVEDAMYYTKEGWACSGQLDVIAWMERPEPYRVKAMPPEQG